MTTFATRALPRVPVALRNSWTTEQVQHWIDENIEPFVLNASPDLVSRTFFDAVRQVLSNIETACRDAGCQQGAEMTDFIRALRVSRPAAPFQARVQPWLLECFGDVIAGDRRERNHRFFEEATELVQACGMTASEAHQLVDYTYGRDIGEPHQEVGGVMVTLAALCLANDLNMHVAGETELTRISVPETLLKIRAKQAAKPKHSPLPEMTAAEPDRSYSEGLGWYAYLNGLDRDDYSCELQSSIDAWQGGYDLAETAYRGRS